MSSEKWVTVLTEGKIQPGEIAGAKVGEAEIAIYNVGGTYYATANICSHAYALLSDGFLDGEVIECPLHAGAFEVKTGKAVCAPALEDIKSYPTRIVGGDIQIRVE